MRNCWPSVTAFSPLIVEGELHVYSIPNRPSIQRIKLVFLARNVFYLPLYRDCDDKSILTDEDNKMSKIKGFSGMGR